MSGARDGNTVEITHLSPWIRNFFAKGYFSLFIFYFLELMDAHGSYSLRNVSIIPIYNRNDDDNE